MERDKSAGKLLCKQIDQAFGSVGLSGIDIIRADDIMQLEMPGMSQWFARLHATDGDAEKRFLPGNDRSVTSGAALSRILFPG